jgi:hypothetical protein
VTYPHIDQAKALHVELLQNLPGPAGDARDALSAVVKLHAPAAPDAMPYLITCNGCDLGPHPEGGADWPCSTIETINAYAHVPGLPTA